MVQPVEDGYSSNIKEPVIEDAGTLADWESMYIGLLDHLKDLVDHGKAQEAYKEIPLVMDISQNYTTNGQNVAVSDKSNFDNTLSQYINAIQEDFDQYSSGSVSDTKYAQDAQYAAQQINALMTDSKYEDFAGELEDVTRQLDAIVPSSQSTPTDLAGYWAGLWELPSPSATTQSSTYQGTSLVSNAINAARNDVESQNTILNSQMQTYSSDASKYLAFEQDCYRSEIDMIQAPVTAAQSASS
ncbi:MAG: hypothetical protein QNJ27_01340 [Simkaniaceae bacterium]|nr:hypothetical protein [Simkaniaceae bacterium]